MFVKNLRLAILFPLLFAVSSHAQTNNPELLKEPSTWTFEKFQLPPEFAPSFPYHGFEELRFSPGMFTKTAHDYFTYAFAAAIDNAPSFTKANLQDYLEQYFKGLCGKTARDRKLSIDTSLIKVISLAGKKEHYKAVLHVFGVFADGAPVTLNMEIKLINNKPASKWLVVFIASPNPVTDGVWKQLYAIRDNFKPHYALHHGTATINVSCNFQDLYPGILLRHLQ